MKPKKHIFGLIVVLLIGYSSLSQTLKVMTYNIRLDVASDGVNAWPIRKDFLASQIHFYELDVLGIQEAMPNQVIDLEHLLPEYDHIGIGREGEGKGESSAIFYKKETLTPLQTETFWLSETPNAISMGWDAACHRVCTYALFKNSKTKKLFWVFNTHLDHIGEQARTKGIQLILSKIEQRNPNQYPVILMGDLNSEPNEKQILAVKQSMLDTREVSQQKPFGPEGTFNNFEHQKQVSRRIDYIFISKIPKVEVKKYAVLSDSKDLKYPSDHLPVYVELTF